MGLPVLRLLGMEMTVLGAAFRVALLSIAILVLSAGSAAAQKSQSDYLSILDDVKFRAWHFMKWDSVFHPVDYWVRHSADDRAAAQVKLDAFIKGTEVLPKGFQQIKVPAGDIKLSGALYLVDEQKRPLVVLVPGTFGSHLSAYIAETARLIALSGKFHVLLLASRMSVSTVMEQKVLGSGGILESRDTLAAIQWARTKAPWCDLVGKVGLYGVSLSADYVVQTMALDRAGLVDTGLVVCGAYYPEQLAAEIDRKGTGTINRVKYLWAAFFLKALRMHAAFLESQLHLGLTADDIKNFKLSDYGPRLSFKFYTQKFTELFGHPLSYAEFQEKTNCLNVVANISRPLLAIHSHQDNWMGSEHADEAARRAAGNPNFLLHYVDGAGHAAYFIHDPVWFHHLLQTYFTYWLEPGPAPEHHAYSGEAVTAVATPAPPANTPQQEAAERSADAP